MRQPVIGITSDCETAGGFSPFPWLALRRNYAQAVVRAGGVPIVLPQEPDAVEEYLQVIDGLVISGGHFDVDPALFGASERHATVRTKDERTTFEIAITRGVLDRDLPVLGICGGQQLLHVLLGGTLIQHIPDAVANAIAHESSQPRNEPAHMVHIHPGTLLHAIVGVEELPVNSAHHQAVDRIPNEIVVGATAPDGVVEAIESPSRRFCLGVQWHPEFEITDGDRRIFAAFVDAARGGQEQHSR